MIHYVRGEGSDEVGVLSSGFVTLAPFALRGVGWRLLSRYCFFHLPRPVGCCHRPRRSCPSFTFASIGVGLSPHWRCPHPFVLSQRLFDLIGPPQPIRTTHLSMAARTDWPNPKIPGVDLILLLCSEVGVGGRKEVRSSAVSPPLFSRARDLSCLVFSILFSSRVLLIPRISSWFAGWLPPTKPSRTARPRRRGRWTRRSCTGSSPASSRETSRSACTLPR